MTFTSPTDDIIVQGGTAAFGFNASGTVYAGQAVYVDSTKSPMYVQAPGISNLGPKAGCVGIAAYKETTLNPVAVYGVGNICRGVISGTCTAGDILYCGSEGKLELPTDWVQPITNPSGVYFIALETVATNGDPVRVMII